MQNTGGYHPRRWAVLFRIQNMHQRDNAIIPIIAGCELFQSPQRTRRVPEYFGIIERYLAKRIARGAS